MRKSQLKMSAPGWYAEKEPTKDAPASLTIEVDGKQEVVTADDVLNLRAQQASATQKTQTVAAIIQAAEKFGLSPEEYVAQADGAFGVMGNLIDGGVIDNTGNLVKQKALDVKDTDNKFAASAAQPGNKTEERLAKLETLLQSIPGEIQTLRQDQTYVIRQDLQRQIQGKHPELTDDDVSRVFGTAMNDPKKASVWQHAEDFAKQKTTSVADQRKQFAEEFGINLEQHDENLLRQKSPDGAAAHIVKGKKLSFNVTSKDKDAITPLTAMREHLSQVNRQ